MTYPCRYNTELKCDGECCDRCTNHPMYIKGREVTLKKLYGQPSMINLMMLQNV